MPNGGPDPDLYTLLHLPYSSEWNICSVLGDVTGRSAKTIQRKFAHHKSKYALGASPRWDGSFWREHGYLSEQDWNYFQKSAPELMAEILKDLSLKKTDIPEDIRKVHPNFLKFISLLLGLKFSVTQNNDAPPLIEPAVNFIITTIIDISEAYFALMKQNLKAYDISVKKLRRLPIPFSKKHIYEKFNADDKTENAFENFCKEFFLLAILCFDMAFVTFLFSEDYTRGESALVGTFQEFPEDKNVALTLRNSIFAYLKNEMLKIDSSKKNTNEALYLFLAGDNKLQAETIKKQCIRVKKKHPTPKDLKYFLERYFKRLGIDKASIDECVYDHMNLFAFYLMVEIVEYIYAGISRRDLSDKLRSHRKWLCQEVFNCPFPD